MSEPGESPHGDGSTAIPALPNSVITALRARHVAFLADRLTDERARGDFERSLEAGYDHVLELPLRALVQPQALVGQLETALARPVVRGLLSPIVREVHRRVLAALRTDQTRLGDFVPDAARAAIDELLARPDILPEGLVRKLVDEEVVEEIMRDVTYDALREFNDTVNPFFADWGLPALIKRVLPIGSGAVLKSISAVRGEFDKRLEPEIRKFLLGFSRRAKGKLADFLVTHAADPKMVELRKTAVAYFYGESLAAITKDIDDDARMGIDEAAEEVVLAVLANPDARARLIAELDALLAEHGDETVGAWLARIGVTERPAFEALAAILWPYLELALKSPPARAFWERVTWDFYATLPRDDG